MAQVVDVSQGLLSVKKCTKSINRVEFAREGSYIENKATGIFFLFGRRLVI